MLAIPILLVIVCVGLCRWATGRYESMMARATKEQAPTAHTGTEVVRLFLAFEGIDDVEIVEHGGTVTNYFDPKRRRLFLSRDVAQGTTMAAWTLALHEAAHALQNGDDLNSLKWRRTCISLTRYAPVGAGLMLFVVFLLRRLPGKMAVLAFLGVCGAVLLMNMGSLAIEFNANARVLKWLEERLSRYPGAIEKLQQLLGPIATRELGDLFNSPRYFFLSALPGTGGSRPTKKD